MLSHAGRIDNYYRKVARTGALKPRPKPLKKESPTLRRNFLRTFNEALFSTSGRKMKAMERLLEDGFNPNREDKMRRTVLSVAAEAGNAPLVRLLLRYGADVHARGKDGRTALERGVSGRSIKSDEVVKILIKAGADVNARNSKGETPLFHAHSDKTAKILVEAGANINARNNLNQTPIHKGTPELVRFLVKEGADVNAKDNIGETPLHYALYIANISENFLGVKALLESGANVDARDNQGFTPRQNFLRFSPFHIHFQMAKLLDKYGAK